MAARALDVSGLVLAGGRGTRFGGGKALADFLGEPLVLRPARALAAVARDVVVAAGPRDGAALAAALPQRFRVIVDEGGGPLAALLAGVRHARGRWIAVAPCDAPLVTPELYRLLLARAADADAAVAAVGGVPNPLVAAYRRDALDASASRALTEGRRAARDALSGLRVVEVGEADLASVPFGADSVADADTPEALARLRARVTREGSGGRP